MYERLDLRQHDLTKGGREMDEIQEKIEKYIEKIYKEMQLYSAEDMIKTFTAYTFFRDQSKFGKEFISAKAQMLIGYAMKAATNKGKYEYTYLNYEKIILLADRIFDLYSEILTHKNDDTTKYSEDDKLKLLVESTTKMKYMFYRKEGYTLPVMMFGRELYKPLDSKLKEIYGFSYSDLEKFYMYVMKTYKSRFKKYLQDREKFIKTIDVLNNNISQPKGDDILSEYVIRIFKGNFFEIKKNELFYKLGEQTVNAIINKFGANFRNKLNENYNYPVDFNDILSHPILDFGDYMLMPDIRFGLMNLPKLLHYDLISGKIISYDKEKCKQIVNEYSCLRGSVIEECVEKFFARLFPRSKVYRSLKYGANKVFECDITVDYGKIVIVCECKGKLLNLSSAKGNFESIKDDFSKAIQNAYNQAYRTQEYIKTGESFFLNEKKIRLDKNAKIIKICITAENYGYIASNPIFLLNISKGDKYPIILSIHDLNVVTEELKNGMEMVNYLEYRESLSCRVHTIEEMDTLIAFKKQLTDKNDTTSNYMFLGITEDINNKYLIKAEEFIEEYKL